MENPLQQGRFFNNGVLHCYARTYSRNPFGAGAVFQCTTDRASSGTRCRNPFGAGAVFQFNNPRQFIFDYGSQSLWSRDGFSIELGDKYARFHTSQSLWSRDGFSIHVLLLLFGSRLSQSLWSRDGFSIWLSPKETIVRLSQSLWSRDGFSMRQLVFGGTGQLSQSLWSRDGFSIELLNPAQGWELVAIPLEQGRFFNAFSMRKNGKTLGRNPFGAGTIFQFVHPNYPPQELRSQSLWSRDGFSIFHRLICCRILCRNPFGAGTVFQYSQYCQSRH